MFESVKHQTAFDMPESSADAYWTPVGYGKRFLEQGIAFKPEFPYAAWWTQYSFQKHCLARDIPDSGAVFGKIADYKHPTLDAQVYYTGEEFRHKLWEYGVPGETSVVLANPTLFYTEYRFFVAHGRVTTGSWYKDGRGFWDGLDWQPDSLSEALVFAQEQVDSMTEQPHGFSIDVGYTVAGYKIVECNPAWASSPYGSEPKGFAESLIASWEPGNFPWAS